MQPLWVYLCNQRHQGQHKAASTVPRHAAEGRRTWFSPFCRSSTGASAAACFATSLLFCICSCRAGASAYMPSPLAPCRLPSSPAARNAGACTAAASVLCWRSRFSSMPCTRTQPRWLLSLGELALHHCSLNALLEQLLLHMPYPVCPHTQPVVQWESTTLQHHWSGCAGVRCLLMLIRGLQGKCSSESCQPGQGMAAPQTTELRNAGRWWLRHWAQSAMTSKTTQLTQNKQGGSGP